MRIKLKILDEKVYEFGLPHYATTGSAALDLRVLLDNPVDLVGGKSVILRTGLAVYIENPAYAGLVVPRSGLGHKHGLVLGNLLGLIDSDYQGELLLSCWNRGRSSYRIHNGDRVAQLVIVPVQQAEFTVVKDFYTTERGTGGYGSTGKA